MRHRSAALVLALTPLPSTAAETPTSSFIVIDGWEAVCSNAGEGRCRAFMIGDAESALAVGLKADGGASLSAVFRPGGSLEISGLPVAGEATCSEIGCYQEVDLDRGFSGNVTAGGHDFGTVSLRGVTDSMVKALENLGPGAPFGSTRPAPSPVVPADP